MSLTASLFIKLGSAFSNIVLVVVTATFRLLYVFVVMDGRAQMRLVKTGAGYLVVPPDTAWWTAHADADPRLVCIDAQPYARIYQVQR